MINLYEVLGVARDATAKDIKAAFKRLAHKHHPDRPDGNKDLYIKVTLAYETLRDPKKREYYDLTGSAPPSKKEIDGKAAQILVELINQIITGDVQKQQVASMFRIDFSTMTSSDSFAVKCRDVIRECRERSETENTALSKKLSGAEREVKKLRRKKGDPFLEEAFDRFITEQKRKRESVRQQLALFDRVIDILDCYETSAGEQPWLTRNVGILPGA